MTGHRTRSFAGVIGAGLLLASCAQQAPVRLNPPAAKLSITSPASKATVTRCTTVKGYGLVNYDQQIVVGARGKGAWRWQARVPWVGDQWTAQPVFGGSSSRDNTRYEVKVVVVPRSVVTEALKGRPAGVQWWTSEKELSFSDVRLAAPTLKVQRARAGTEDCS